MIRASLAALAAFVQVVGGCAVAHGQTVPLVVSSDAPDAVRATIAGRSGLFMLDSGLGTTAVTPSFAAQIGCKPWGKVTGFRATGERLDLPRCNQADLTLGPVTRSMPQLSVIDLVKFMGPPGARFSGALGLDAFEGRIVTFEVAKNRLTVEDAASLDRIKRTATEVPVRLVRAAEGAALTVDLGVPTASGTAWMEIDTGDYGPSLVDRTVAPLVGLRPDASGVQSWMMRMPDGLQITGPAIVKDLILDGDIGRDVLRRWAVTLDLAKARGWIRPE